ncbi:MAG TPA: hypothetical protein VMK32_04430 [Burkholderiaceae bacterium]|nr:hypothetical protein [Burkholderiaceae bacterium]
MSEPGLWRLAASHTHLYPGARLRCLEEPSDLTLRAGDGVLVEFSDGQAVRGRIEDVIGPSAKLATAAYRTARGAEIPQKRWFIVPGGAFGVIKVKSRA